MQLGREKLELKSGIAFEKKWEEAYSGRLRFAEEVGWDDCCHLDSARKLILFRIFTGRSTENWPVIFRDIYSATVWLPSFQAYWILSYEQSCEVRWNALLPFSHNGTPL